jgi:hypothetical protein
VLRYHAISLYRRASRTCSDSGYLNTVALPCPSSVEDDLAEVLLDFRRLCDLANFPRRTANGPELAAVFALETRLRLLANLVHCNADFLDTHLPLRDWERRLRVQRDWPPVGELWGRLANCVEPRLRNVDTIRRACRELLPEAAVEGMHRVWNTWLVRAKGIVSRQLRSHAQAQLFFHLFPNRRSVKVKTEQDETDDGRRASCVG